MNGKRVFLGIVVVVCAARCFCADVFFSSHLGYGRFYAVGKDIEGQHMHVPSIGGGVCVVADSGFAFACTVDAALTRIMLKTQALFGYAFRWGAFSLIPLLGMDVIVSSDHAFGVAAQVSFQHLISEWWGFALSVSGGVDFPLNPNTRFLAGKLPAETVQRVALVALRQKLISEGIIKALDLGWFITFALTVVAEGFSWIVSQSAWIAQKAVNYFLSDTTSCLILPVTLRAGPTFRI